MSGMNPQLDSLLGYRDGYVATPDSRAIYNLTWNGCDQSKGAWLNLLSTAVIIKAPITPEQRSIAEEVADLFGRTLR